MKLANLNDISLGTVNCTRDGSFLNTYGNANILCNIDSSGDYEIVSIKCKHTYYDSLWYFKANEFETNGMDLHQGQGIEFEFGSPITSLRWGCDYVIRFYIVYRDWTDGGATKEYYVNSYYNNLESPNNISPEREPIPQSDVICSMPDPQSCAIIDNFTTPFSPDIERWKWFFYYSTEPGGEPILFYEKETFIRADIPICVVNGQQMDFYDGYPPNDDVNEIKSLVIPAPAKEIQVLVFGHNRKHGWSEPGVKTIPVEQFTKPTPGVPQAQRDSSDENKITFSVTKSDNNNDVRWWGVQIANDSSFSQSLEVKSFDKNSNQGSSSFTGRSTGKQYLRCIVKYKHTCTYISNLEVVSSNETVSIFFSSDKGQTAV